MRNIKKRIENSPFYSSFFGKKFKNLYVFFLNLIPSVAAGLMEGFSYVSLLCAVNVMRQESLGSVPFVSFLLSFVDTLSQNKQFLFFITLALFIQFIRSLFLFLSQYIVTRMSLVITTEIQHKIYKQIFSFSYPFVSKYQMGDLLNYNTLPTVIPAILSSANTALFSTILGLISFAWLIKIDPILSIILVGCFVSVNFFYKLLIKKINSLSIELATDQVDLSSQTSQNINGIKLIHMFHKQDSIISSIKSLLYKIASSNTKLTFWKTLSNSLGEIIGILILTLMLIIGSFLLHHKPGFISYLLIFIFISYRLASRMQIALDQVAVIMSFRGSIDRIKEILKKDDKEYIPFGGKPYLGLNSSMKMQDISFNYAERKEQAINNFSYTFKKAKTYAIIGKSGAGKSTLIDILLRLYEPKKGKIFLDNINYTEYSLQSWRDAIGIVNQDVFLFHDTIENNIKFANPSATKENILKASKMAYADEYISKLPQGYQTVIGEKGQKLSGGERQRLALARSLVKNPEILILDEATSQLDSHSEKLIQTAIDGLKKQKTIIIIAHRLSTVVNSDEILVMNNGKLIENGSHKELLQKNGSYSYFWNIQSKGKASNKQLEEFNLLEK